MLCLVSVLDSLPCSGGHRYNVSNVLASYRNYREHRQPTCPTLTVHRPCIQNMAHYTCEMLLHFISRDYFPSVISHSTHHFCRSFSLSRFTPFQNMRHFCVRERLVCTQELTCRVPPALLGQLLELYAGALCILTELPRCSPCESLDARALL